MMIKSALLSVLLLSLQMAVAHETPSSSATIDSVRITPLDDTTQDTLFIYPRSPSVQSIDTIITTIDGLIAVGEKIWKIIDASRPVVSTDLAKAVSVLPDIDGKTPALYKMAHWSMPKYKSFRIAYLNSRGDELVGFTYTIYFQYNGSYNGRGKYIANLKIKASEISTSMFQNFSAKSELVGIGNGGSVEDPMAQAMIELTYTVKNVTREINKTATFYVDGLGNIQVHH